MSDLPSKVSRALDDAVQALCQNRAHVLLVADEARIAALPRLLAAKLSARIPVKHLPLETRSLAGIDRVLAGFEANLVLLVPEAHTLEPTALKHLGERCCRAGNGLQLVLFAQRADAEKEEPAAALVRGLGLGAEKIEIGAPPAAVPRRPNASGVLPPWSVRGKARPARPIALRSVAAARHRARRRQLGQPAGRLLPVLLLAAPALLWVGAPRVPPAPFEFPPLMRTALAQPASIPEIRTGWPAAESTAGSENEAEPSPALPAQPAPAVPAPPEPAAPPPAAPAPASPPPSPPTGRTVTRVPVSLNAQPWANIEIDGVSLGATPIGD